MRYLKNKQITITDVAREADVSIATVSNVLNRSHRGNIPLSQAAIDKVEGAVERLGYRRNVMAASLSSKKTYELGLILPSFGGYFADFAHLMQEMVHLCGYQLSVFSSSQNPELEQRHLETLLQRRVDGLFCHGLAMSPDSTRQFVGKGTPLVLFNAWGWPSDIAIGAVNLDFAGGAAAVVLHLLERGCRSLIYVSKKKGRATDQQRMIGFQQGVSLGHAAGEIHHQILVAEDMEEEELIRSIAAQADSGYPVGVLAFDDHDAFILISKLRQRNCQVPAQVKVAGINDRVYSRYSWPSITSLAIDLKSQVLHAVHLLLAHLGETAALDALPLDNKIICRQQAGLPHEINIPMELKPRMSTE